MSRLPLTINGRRHVVDAAPDTPLLWVLRDALGLTGTKYGCGQGQCGACTVHLGGAAVRACTTPLSAVGALPVTTVEGLRGPVADALRAAWAAHDVPQCGYCQAGQLMQADALLRRDARMTDEALLAGMRGNVCRCGTYGRIRAALRDARRALGAPAGASSGEA
jgi:isoquinoline 1-oxidoreductase subunit alpha